MEVQDALGWRYVRHVLLGDRLGKAVVGGPLLRMASVVCRNTTAERGSWY